MNLPPGKNPGVGKGPGVGGEIRVLVKLHPGKGPGVGGGSQQLEEGHGRSDSGGRKSHRPVPVQSAPIALKLNPQRLHHVGVVLTQVCVPLQVNLLLIVVIEVGKPLPIQTVVVLELSIVAMAMNLA